MLRCTVCFEKTVSWAAVLFTQPVRAIIACTSIKSALLNDGLQFCKLLSVKHSVPVVITDKRLTMFTVLPIVRNWRIWDEILGPVRAPKFLTIRHRPKTCQTSTVKTPFESSRSADHFGAFTLTIGYFYYA